MYAFFEPSCSVLHEVGANGSEFSLVSAAFIESDAPLSTIGLSCSLIKWILFVSHKVSVNQEPRVPESRGQASNPPRGAIPRGHLREVKKTKSRERVLGATVSGPRVPRFPDDLLRLSDRKKELGEVNGDPEHPSPGRGVPGAASSSPSGTRLPRGPTEGSSGRECSGLRAAAPKHSLPGYLVFADHRGTRVLGDHCSWP